MRIIEKETVKRKTIPKKVRLEVYKMYDGHCAYCGCEIEYKEMQVDHIHPFYLEGKDIKENYRPACRMCNFYKSTFSIEGFREQIGLITGRLEKEFIYRMAKKYGLIDEKEVEIKFYFEENAKEGETMKISEKIEKLKSKCKSERYIDIFYTEAEYHPSNTGFYLSDLANYPIEDFVPKELLEKQLVSDREYTKKGLTVIALGFN